ncbi:Zinc finger SWIM-type [Arabidopsis thaliana x Arabidopsis arenosa]|uniref:Zinc finger SWIM-type n=1 Tax=Arabidopsis thaliana x Arabidopsis arenosa TaxID=1240361 RepID=A0A8T1ZQ79_9BRAS|nr:Zinc finger SWIM-type [Arabidopsis thaliana x Arabidopsis arenosa]
MEGELESFGAGVEAPEGETGDGVRAPPAEVAAESGGVDEATVGVSETVAVEKARDARRRRKRRRARDVEVDDEPELDPEPDLEDDCAVFADEDINDVDDAVGQGDNDDNDGNDGNIVEEDPNLNIAADFPDAYRVDEEAGSDSDSGDDIWEDDKIPDPLSSDDEDEVRAGEEAGGRDEDDPEVLLAVEKTFNSPDDFKRAVLMYSLKTRYNIKLYRSESMMVAAKCCYIDDEGVQCPWRVYCSYEKKKHKMQIRVYINEHSCVRSGYTKMLKRSSIAELFEERLRLNPKLTKYEMVAEIKREYRLEVTPDQCAKAKTKVLRARNASHETHFARIWDYQAEVCHRNPGTEFEIETIAGAFIGSKQKFFRLYICFKSQKDSWKQHCRPVIGIDGAFLKWDIKGHLLAAVGRDGDNRIVPLAWAVVEIENDDNWDWFLRKLSSSLGLCEMANLAILSDKQSGLVKAIHTILPQAEHRQCSKHIMDNWKRDSHDVELQRLFWKIARSYTIEEFNSHMAELKRYNPHAYASLQLTSPMTWSRAFFRVGTCCNDNLNNLSESFNRTIRQARRKPLLDLLEDIRRQCMVRTAKRFLIADRLKTRFTPRAHVEIEKMIAGAANCERHMARNNLHEIYVNGVGYFVDMDLKTCGCRKWQMVGIPCVHAACVILGRKEKVEDYVSDYYTKLRWRETYRDGIRPVQGMPLWPTLNRLAVLPPPWRRGNAGRPSNYARRKGRNETASSSSKNKRTTKDKSGLPQQVQGQGAAGHGSQGQGAAGHGSQASQGSRAHGSQGQRASQGSRAHGSQGQRASQSTRAHGSQGQRASQRQGSRAHGGPGAQPQSQAQPQAEAQAQPQEQGLAGLASWFQCST